MRAIFVLTVLIGVFWAIDTLAFDGRYTQTVWREAKYQGQQINYEIQYWLRKARVIGSTKSPQR